MRIRIRSAAWSVVALLLASCADVGVVDPGAAPLPSLDVGGGLPPVRFSEIHYDNTGTDVGEAIEVSAPAGTDLTGWSIVLYNGNGGAPYDTKVLSGTVPATCGDRGVVVQAYPSNGIQNGSPDGMALVRADGTVVEYLSYEGTFVAVGGPANGMLSTDIGAQQTGSGPIGESLQRNSSGVWALGTNTFGACNDNGPVAVVVSVTVAPTPLIMPVGATQQLTATAFDAGGTPIGGVSFDWSSSNPAAAVVGATGLVTAVAEGAATITAMAPNGVTGGAAVTVTLAPPPGATPRFNEVHYDNTGADQGEAIEIEGAAGLNLAGWSVVLYNGNGGVQYGTYPLSGVIPNLCAGRGVTVILTPAIQNGDPDGFALISPTNVVVEFLSYGGTFTATNGPASGLVSVDIGVKESSATPVGHSLQRDVGTTWFGPVANSFGACNPPPPPPPPSTISFAGRNLSDPPLPVGFQDQLFATLRDGGGVVVPTTWTWSMETPATGSIDPLGVLTALAPGVMTVRATAADGTTGTWTLPAAVATASATAQYAGNAEFGEPTDATPADDFLVQYPQFTSSWNPTRGTPNWVSYNLEASHFGSQDRCDCFTFDPYLPAAFSRYTTADYTGAGAFHGYGIDRGHLARSFDRTSGSLDNAHTFYFTNIIPQAADQNQGPWAAMEIYLGDLARFQNKEVYIIAGVAGSKGTIKNEGRITIPAATWKVAVIMPRDAGLPQVSSWADLEVLAVIMPNDPGIRNVPWQSYLTTVDAVELVSGYDLLALLPDQVEIAVESNTRPPTAVINGPFTVLPGETVALSAAGSSDPDGDALSYGWTFGNGGTGSGLTPTAVYAAPGIYTVTLTVTDIRGLYATATTTVTVQSPAEVLGQAAGLIDALVGGGGLSAGNGNALQSKLENAIMQLGKGNPTAALGMLGAFQNQLDALEGAGRISGADAAALRTLVARVIASLGG